jgi:hypothetical protein
MTNTKMTIAKRMKNYHGDTEKRDKLKWSILPSLNSVRWRES